MRNITSPAIHGFFLIIGLWVIGTVPQLSPIYILLLLYRLLRHWFCSYLKLLDLRFFRNIFYTAFVLLTIIAINSNSDNNGNNENATMILYLIAASFLLLGILLHFFSRRMRNRLERRYNRYKELMIEEKISQIKQFADRLRIHPNYVRNDFRYLNASGKFYIYFDENADRIHLHEEESYEDEYDNENYDETYNDNNDFDVEENQSNNSKVAASEPPPPTQLPKNIRCSSCGAPTVLHPNEYTSCKYCGTSISYS